MLQQIEEPCSLGAHAAVIVPPTWIIHVRRPQVHTQAHLVILTVSHSEQKMGLGPRVGSDIYSMYIRETLHPKECNVICCRSI